MAIDYNKTKYDPNQNSGRGRSTSEFDMSTGLNNKKQLTEDDVRKIIRDENHKNSISGAPKVAPHNHDGNNGFKINESDLISSLKGNTLLKLTGNGTFTFDTTSNPKTLHFYGFAANNNGGDGYEKAIVNGIAELGGGYLFGPQTGNDALNITTLVVGQPQNIIQLSNAMYMNVNFHFGPMTAFVEADQQHFVYVDNGVSSINVVALVWVDSFTSKTVTVKYEIDSNWEVSGNFLIT